MTILISDNCILTNETQLVSQMFDLGLDLFHVRKYQESEQSLRLFLKSFSEQRLSKISLHHHHHLCEEFGMRRIHFSEQSRKDYPVSHFEKLKQSGYVLSTSVHHLQDYLELSEAFEYAFLSPVFHSISKPDYPAVDFGKVVEIKKTSPQLIALGGIDSKNILTAYKLGYGGVALLGSVWKSENPVNAFKKIQDAVVQSTYRH